MSRIQTPETRAKIGAANRGRKRPDLVALNKTIDRSGPRIASRKHTKDLSVFRKKRLGVPLTSQEETDLKAYYAAWARQKNDTARGRATTLLMSARYAAKKHSLRCDLTVDWIEEKIAVGRCEVSGLPFHLGTRHPYVPSLDRKLPGGPYTKENVQVVVWIYNTAKQQYSHDFVMKLARALVERQ
jgi:hypothetical protein